MTNEAQQVNNYLQEIETQLAEEKARSAQMTRSQVGMYSADEQENLIRWQLDLKEDLDRIYHLLKGDIIKMDKDNNSFWAEPTEDKLKPFNEFGVQLIMNILCFYLNRNTILSNYKEDVINWKVLDFGNELADLIHNRYQEMGMNSKDKIKMYPMIIRELVDTVHSAYLRAFNGGERSSLKEARVVTQSEPLGRGFSSGGGGMQQPKRKTMNPMTWF